MDRLTKLGGKSGSLRLPNLRRKDGDRIAFWLTFSLNMSWREFDFKLNKYTRLLIIILVNINTRMVNKQLTRYGMYLTLRSTLWLPFDPSQSLCRFTASSTSPPPPRTGCSFFRSSSYTSDNSKEEEVTWVTFLYGNQSGNYSGTHWLLRWMRAVRSSNN